MNILNLLDEVEDRYGLFASYILLFVVTFVGSGLFIVFLYLLDLFTKI